MVSFLSARGGALLGVRTVADVPCRSDRVTVVLCRGEVDRSNVEDFRGALARIELGTTTSVHAHVSGLDFIDVGGLRVLADFARAVRDSGRTFRTCEARPGLRRAARVMGLQDDLDLA